MVTRVGWVRLYEQRWVSLHERQGLTKRNSQHDAGARAQNRISTTSRLLAVRNAAKKDKARQFTSLMHHLTIDLLEQSFRALSHQAAAGADGVTWAEYETQLRDNLVRAVTLSDGAICTIGDG